MIGGVPFERRHRVVASKAPGVASEDTPNSEEEASEETVSLESNSGVLATRGVIAAGGRRIGADEELVSADKFRCDETEPAVQFLPPFSF